MKARIRGALLLAPALLLGSRYRTTYNYFRPEEQSPQAAVKQPLPVRKGRWQHFFIWGWVSGERHIEAVEKCGGAGRVHSIETRQTFVEGMVAAVAGFYVNVYSPWNGAIYCTNRPD